MNRAGIKLDSPLSDPSVLLIWFYLWLDRCQDGGQWMMVDNQR